MNLFTYGTLMDPAVWSSVAREECARRRAVLRGYEVRKLRGVAFPGLAEARCGCTEGWLYMGVSASAMERLDAYEDDCYVRAPLPVELEDGTTMMAQVYLVAPDYRWMVLPEKWLPPG